MLLHFLQELYDHLTGRSDEDLTPTTLFCVGNGLQTIG